MGRNYLLNNGNHANKCIAAVLGYIFKKQVELSTAYKLPNPIYASLKKTHILCEPGGGY